jgi:alkylation response protein AidB-like acyl-CoA dehydrogenase
VIEVVTAERAELVDLVRRFLTERSPLSEIRRSAESGGYDQAVWAQMGKELGLPALGLPEEFGGMGYGPVEVGLVMSELGRGLYNGPYFSSVCLAATILVEAATPEQCGVYLPKLASGESTAALAFAEPDGPWNGAVPTAGPAARLEQDGGTHRLTGTKTLVVDGATADLLLVTVATEGSNDLTLVAVDPSAEGVTRRALPTLDLTRALAVIEFSGAPATVIGDLGSAGPAFARTLAQAAVYLAAEQLGGAGRCLDMAVDYAKIREQFNRPIGSFQAVKHRCVDMLTDVETSRSAVLLALTAMARGDGDLAEVSSLARAHCSEAFSRVAAANIAVHGGIGFTWEHDAHLFLKRAKASEGLLGSPTEHREMLAAAIGL